MDQPHRDTRLTAYFTFNIDKNTTGKPREGEIEFTLPDKTNTKVRIVQSATDNTINFLDANFKAYMVANFDKNKDGEISEYEASLITEIDCANKNIESLKGIEHCTALTELYCDENQLTTLDISGCSALTSLDCSSNQLTSLDVTGTNIGYYDSGMSYTQEEINPKYTDEFGNYNLLKGHPFPSDLFITVRYYYYPLDCSNMPTLQTLYLKASWWTIRGINIERSTDYIPEQTEIISKD